MLVGRALRACGDCLPATFAALADKTNIVIPEVVNAGKLWISVSK